VRVSLMASEVKWDGSSHPIFVLPESNEVYVSIVPWRIVSGGRALRAGSFAGERSCAVPWNCNRRETWRGPCAVSRFPGGASE